MKKQKAEEIVTRAILKAIGNGYCFPFIDAMVEIIYGENRWVYSVIFSHDFAKAFWGNREVIPIKECHSWALENWQYHLQQMVLEEEPWEYLEGFLDKLK